jgi:hypothetical protein
VLPNDDGGSVGQKTGLPQERYQFHFPSGQFMDRDDRQINLVEYLNGKMAELKDYFKPEFAKGLVTKGGNKVEINYPESSSGKFIALYGFDDSLMSLRSELAGFKNVFIPGIKIEHIDEGQTPFQTWKQGEANYYLNVTTEGKSIYTTIVEEYKSGERDIFYNPFI